MLFLLVLFLTDSTSKAIARSPALDAGRWWVGVGASLVAGGVAWKVAQWVYIDFLRPRLDRYVSDARRRRPDDEDTIRLESRARTGVREDVLLLDALARVMPAHDLVVLGAIERNPAEFRHILREHVLAEDYKAAAERAHVASQALAVAEACATALEGISAAQLAQGRALGELPRIAGVLETFNGTVDRMDETLRTVNVQIQDMARAQGEVRGILDEVRRREYTGPERRQEAPRGRRLEDRLPIHDDDGETPT